VVVDSTLRLPLDAHVLTDGAAPTLVVTTRRATASRIDAVRRSGAEVLIAGENETGQVDLRDALRHLYDRDIISVLIEGGARLITSALHEQIVHRLIVCIAPKVVGSGIDAVGNLDIVRMGDALHFGTSSFTTVGEDIIFDGTVSYELTANGQCRDLPQPSGFLARGR
jgi:5-amino-6-(5-phosphoribosylamino)uracil reductase/diaminohydroxyphosphoribosylaminopyrimidine deaminase/5-amino-6-(5-phosphoribosylamino)uracil reductase